VNKAVEKRVNTMVCPLYNGHVATWRNNHAVQASRVYYTCGTGTL